MTITRQKAKGRRERGAFVALPCTVLSHPNFSRMTAKGHKLFNDLLAQLRMKVGGPSNNGDLTIAWSIMEKREWSSKSTLYEAREELQYYDWILMTRQGGKHTASLYGFTFFAINECGGKLDIRETVTALGTGKRKNRYGCQREKQNPWYDLRTTLARPSYQFSKAGGQIHEYWPDHRTNQRTFSLSIGPTSVLLLRSTRYWCFSMALFLSP